MYCGHCGQKLWEAAKFCQNCGNPVIQETTVPESPPALNSAPPLNENRKSKKALRIFGVTVLVVIGIAGALYRIGSYIDRHPTISSSDAPIAVNQVQSTTNVSAPVTSSPVQSIATDNNKKEIEYLEKVRDTYFEIAKLSFEYLALQPKLQSGEMDDYALAEELASKYIPETTRCLQEIQMNMFPPNVEFRVMHENLINALSKQLQGYTEALAALDQQDISKMQHAQALVQEAGQFDRQFAYEFLEYTKKYKINMDSYKELSDLKPI